MRSGTQPRFILRRRDQLRGTGTNSGISTRQEEDENDVGLVNEQDTPRSTWQIDYDTVHEEDLPSSKWGLIARGEFQGRQGPAYTSPSGAVCITLAAPAVYRLQMRARSCEIWFPDTLVTGHDASFGFLIRRMTTCPALAVALDASSLCHLGQEFDDERLLTAGIGMHAKALELLRRELTLPADRQNKAQVGTILTLQIIEAFGVMDFTGPSWLQHSKGLTAILDSIDEDVEGNVPGYPELIASSFYLFHFWAGLAERKRIRCFGPSVGKTLVSIAERVPEALEIADAICEQDNHLPPDEARQAIDNLSKIELELNAWTASWNPCMRTGPFHIVESSKIFEYQSVEGKRTKNPFPLSMEFRTFLDALDHIICTASLLVVREALIDIYLMLSGGSHEMYQRIGKKIGSLKAAANSCAGSLCMAIPYILLPSNGQYGHVLGSHPLRVARRWYLRLQDEQHRAAAEKVQWCGQIATRIRQRGIRPL